MPAVIRVRVSAGASRSAILGWHGDELKVAVRAAPEKGRANAEVAEVLGEALGLRKGDVQLLGGATARQKKFSVSLDMPEILARLDRGPDS